MPHCTPQFNEALNLFVGDLVGLACAGLFAVTLLALLLAVVPALVRSSVLVLIGFEWSSTPVDTDDESTPLLANGGPGWADRSVGHTVRLVFQLSSWLTPFVTGLPLIVVRAFFCTFAYIILLCRWNGWQICFFLLTSFLLKVCQLTGDLFVRMCVLAL